MWILSFKRRRKEEKGEEEESTEKLIPDELKSVLAPSELNTLRKALREKDQKFVVRKYLRWTKDGNPGWMFLPDDENPMYFSSPPTPSDIEVAFGDEFGGGTYHVFAVKPSYTHVYTVKIHWMKSKEPFKPSDESLEEGRKKKKKSKVQEILEAEGIDEKTKSKLVALAYLEDLGLKPKDLGIDLKALFSSEDREEDPLYKAVKEQLAKNPELAKAMAEKYVKKYVEKLFGEEDEIDKLEKYYELITRINPQLAGFGPSPFDYLAMTFLPLLPQLFGGLMGGDMFGNAFGGQQTQQAQQTEMVTIKYKGKVMQIPKEIYELLKRKETVRVKEEGGVKEKQEVRGQEARVNSGIVSRIESALLQTKPDSMAKLIWEKAKQDPLVMTYVEQAVKAETVDQLVEVCKAMYPNPRVHAIIDSLVSKHKDWFEQVLSELKKLYQEEKGEIKHEKEEVELSEEDLKFEEMEVNI